LKIGKLPFLLPILLAAESNNFKKSLVIKEVASITFIIKRAQIFARKLMKFSNVHEIANINRHSYGFFAQCNASHSSMPKISELRSNHHPEPEPESAKKI